MTSAIYWLNGKLTRIVDIDHLKISLRKDNFPLNFVDSSIKSFLNNFFAPKVIVHDIPKRDVFIKLSFSGSTSFQICKKLQKSLTEELTCCNLKTFLGHLLSSKAFSLSRISCLRYYAQDLHTNIRVAGCNVVFYGKTERHYKNQICEHLGISHPIGKKVRIHNSKLTAIQENLWCCSYAPFFEEFPILVTESNDFQFQIIERLHIEHDNLLETYVIMWAVLSKASRKMNGFIEITVIIFLKNLQDMYHKNETFFLFQKVWFQFTSIRSAANAEKVLK